jgi:Protein of unknown function (DUF3485)
VITKRLWRTQLALLVGFGAIFVLPHARISSPAGIAMKLPIWVGPWIGEDAEITAKEVGGLARDTEFARKLYTSPDGDRIFVSIVLSGDDMASSIHRPERCLPAQGWSLQRSERKAIALQAGKLLPVTVLHGARPIDETASQYVRNLDYYWFIGYRSMTPSHFDRTVIDIRDRLLYGYDQRWAYVSAMAVVTEGWAKPNRTEAETAQIVETFTRELVRQLRRPDGANLM